MEILECTVDQLIMAGWVGRNREALQAHIDELAELGIPGPKNVPEFYPLSVDRLSQGSSIQVSGKDTSGVFEFCLRVFGIYIRTHITPILTYLRTSLQIYPKQKANRKVTSLRSGVKLGLMK